MLLQITDMIAIALKMLEPKYQPTKKGKLKIQELVIIDEK